MMTDSEDSRKSTTRSKDSEFVLQKADESAHKDDSHLDDDLLPHLETDESDSNILLIGPQNSPVEHDFCARLSAAPLEDRTQFLVVEVGPPLDERIARLQASLDTESLVLTHVGVGRSADVDRWAVSSDASIETAVISDRTDLGRLGISISTFLAECEVAATRLCLHSLSELIEAIDDRRRVFRFLHLLCGRIRDEDAVAHYHLDPEALDEPFLNQIQQLFDRVVRFDDERLIE